jgi:predicted RNase H-like HicB family nuclease
MRSRFGAFLKHSEHKTETPCAYGLENGKRTTQKNSTRKRRESKAMSHQVKEAMKSEFRNAITEHGETLEDIRDNSGEWIEGYLPVYNNKIVEEWQAMPSEYDNRGAVELGHLEQEINIINLMSLDLYLYYNDIFNEAVNELEEEEEKE